MIYWLDFDLTEDEVLDHLVATDAVFDAEADGWTFAGASLQEWRGYYVHITQPFPTTPGHWDYRFPRTSFDFDGLLETLTIRSYASMINSVKQIWF